MPHDTHTELCAYRKSSEEKLIIISNSLAIMTTCCAVNPIVGVITVSGRKYKIK